jgi:hypothetical protein
MVSKPLLIIGISNDSYSKIIYSYNSHISLYIVTNHIHKFTNTINIDMSIYNLQHISLWIICISSSVVQYTHHISPTNIYNIKSFNKIYELVE